MRPSWDGRRFAPFHDQGAWAKGDTMKKSTLMAAAISGMLLGAGAARAENVGAPRTETEAAQPMDDMAKKKAKKQPKKAQPKKSPKKKASPKGGDKHECKGMNSCKGKGGCKTDKNECKGHNECKGQGGCATDGSK